MKIPQKATAGKNNIREPIAMPIGSPEPTRANDRSAASTKYISTRALITSAPNLAEVNYFSSSRFISPTVKPVRPGLLRIESSKP
jgi:hypothetical protein